MEIWARGWNRDHGLRLIALGDISTASINKDDLLMPGKTRIRPLSPGTAHGISVNTDSELRGLNGHYLVELSLSKNEVARMFALCFQDDPLSEIVGALSRGAESTPAVEN